MTTTKKALLPVGQRPRCLYCTKELRPNFRWNPKPFHLSDEETAAWKKANPKQFLGNYGSYNDDRFCGLNCGYRYAVRVTAKGGR